MCVKLQPAQPEDIKTLLKICRKTMGTPGSMWSEDYPDQEILEEDIQKKTLYKILYVEPASTVEEPEVSQMIGLIAAGDVDELGEFPWDQVKRNACEIARFGIDPDWQGKGLAGKALKLALEKLKEQGYEAVRIFVSKGYEAAVQMYKKAGFRYISDESMWGGEYYAYQKVFEEKA